MVDDNRPLFDDEDLPAWMKEGGITYRGKAAVKFSGVAVDFTKPPWEDTRPDELQRAEIAEVPDWMHTGEAAFDPDEVEGIEVEVPAWMQKEGKPSVSESGRLLPRSGMLRPKQSAPLSEPIPPAPVPTPPPEPIDIFPDVQPIKDEGFTPASSDLDWLNTPAQGALQGDFEQDLQPGNQFDSLDTPIESAPDWLSTSPPPQEVSMPEPANTGSDDDFRALFDQADDLFDKAEEPATQPPAQQPDELSLDWLDRLPEPPAAPAPVSSGSDDLPDWMRDVPSIQANAPGNDDFISSLTGDSGLVPGDLPDWMREAAPPPGGSSATDLSGLDFLNDSSGVGETSEEIPDWLAGAKDSFTSDDPGSFPATGIQPGKFQPKKPGKRDSSEIAFDINAILNLPLSSGEPAEETPAPSTSRDITPYEAAQISASENMLSNSLSDSLSEVSFDDTTIDEAMGPPSGGFKLDLSELEAEQQAPAPETPAAPSLRNRGSNVRKLPAMETPTPAPKVEEPLPSAEESAFEGELPDFVEDMRPDGAPVELNIGGVQIDVPESPITSLSDSLRQLRERSREVGKVRKSEDTPAEGALAEIAGVISPSVVPVSATAEAKQLAPGTVLISDSDQRRIKTLQSLLEVEDEAEKAVQKARRRSRSLRLDRMFVAVLLFAVISVPFFTDVANIMIPPNITAATAEQQSVFAAMDALTPGQVVLVAFEYGPSGSGELDDLARVLLRDIFKKGGKPVIVSTNAAGALHAESLLAVFGINNTELSGLNRIGKPLLARQDYVVLRYLPAGAAGVRAAFNAIYSGGFDRQTQFLTTDIEGIPSKLTDADITALLRAPVIILAETPDEVRTWAEQYRPPGIQKVLFATSAAADAAARSYSASQPTKYIGPLVGLRDATTYRYLRQANSAAPGELKLLDQRWQSTGLGALLAGVFILFGTLFSMIGAIRQRSKPKGETNR